MKKFFISASITLLTLTSCEKDLSSNPNGDQSSPKALAASLATPKKDVIVRIDLTGQQIGNECEGGTLTFLSGILQFNIAPDGVTIRSTVNSQLVMQDANGTIYHGVFVETFGLNGSILHGTVHDTLRFILNPQGGGSKLQLHSMFHITVNANGVFTANVENFTLECK